MCWRTQAQPIHRNLQRKVQELDRHRFRNFFACVFFSYQKAPTQWIETDQMHWELNSDAPEFGPGVTTSLPLWYRKATRSSWLMGDELALDDSGDNDADAFISEDLVFLSSWDSYSDRWKRFPQSPHKICCAPIAPLRRSWWMRSGHELSVRNSRASRYGIYGNSAGGWG